MTKPNLVISASGIRGVVYDGLSPDLVCRLAAAFACSLGRGRYVLGRDTRPSGEVLNHAAIAGITSTGSDVLDVGMCPTPTIQLAVERNEARGGIALTASHNPSEWNALKLISSSGTFLTREGVDRVVGLSKGDGIAYATFDESGRVQHDSRACERHIVEVLNLEYIDADRIRERGFKVALDCVNGAGSAIAPELLRRLGCEVYAVDCEPTGVFTRNPEPLRENIGALCETVRSRTADVGFALDPDADRLAIVDESGKPVGEDYTLVVCADVVLCNAKGPLVTNLSTTMAAEEVAKRHGVDFYRTPIGEINVVTKMKAVGSVIGGEGNGGVILPALHYGRDSLMGMALVLEALAGGGRTVSAVIDEFPRFAMYKAKTSLDDGFDLDRVRALLENQFSGGVFNYEDGIRIDLGDRWLHVRKSGTEPVVRLISEARSLAEAEDLVRKALQLLNK